MTVQELLGELYEGNNELHSFEVWKYTDKTRRLHSDFIQNIDEECGIEVYGSWKVKDYYIMDETEYNNTICCNSSVRADFSEWYNNKDAKILVIMVDCD